MDDLCNCDDTADVYSAGSDLIRQFSKVLEKMKLRQLPSSRDVEQLADEGRERPKLMEAAGGCGCQVGCGNSSNADLVRGALCRQSAVRMEPSELRLVIRLDPWVSEGGQLIVRPSLVTEAAGGSDARSCEPCRPGPGTAAPASGEKFEATVGNAKPGQPPGVSRGPRRPLQLRGADSASGDAGRQQRRPGSSGGESDESADDRSSSGGNPPAPASGGGRRQQSATTFRVKIPQQVRGSGRGSNNK